MGSTALVAVLDLSVADHDVAVESAPNHGPACCPRARSSLGVWLIALAGGADSYASVQQVLGAPWFKVPLVGWTFCFFFHLANGVRHLAWDTGAGFDRARIVATGWTVVVVAVVATAAFSWFAIF